MTKVVVTDKALRELVNELIGPRSVGPSHLADNGSTLGSPAIPDEEPVNVNPTVDPSAAETDPINPDFSPQNKLEFDIAVKNLVKCLPDERMAGLYKDIKSVVYKAGEEAPEGEHGMKNDDENSRSELVKKAEETVRREVKKILSEANMVQAPADDYYTDDEEDDGKKRQFSSMADVEGATFEEIAKELGFSVAGAKQAVDKALLKAQFVAQSDKDDMEILVLNAMNAYVNKLAGAVGVEGPDDDGQPEAPLTAADIKLMKDHPDIIRELDGFRVFLANVIRKERRRVGK